MESLFAALRDAMSITPDAIALSSDDGDLSNEVLLGRSAQYANALHRLDSKAGDRVMVQVSKSADAVALYLGCLCAGRVYVPLNTAYTQTEVAEFAKDAEPSVLVLEQAAVISGVAGHTIAMSGEGSLTALANEQSKEHTGPEPGELAAVLYTSGTTGRSKGAMLSQDNLLSNARSLVKAWGFSEHDVLLHSLPIYHVHGLFVALHTALLARSKILFRERFDVPETLADLPRSTAFMGVPTYYTRLLDDDAFDAATCANMRLFVSGSAPLRAETWQAFERRSGHQILERYGMTETGMIASNPLQGERRAGSVGRPLPGVQVRLRDDAGEPTATGPGVLEVKGPNVFQGYWRMPDRTKEEFTDDGYFKTGDIAEIDDQGVVTLVGRAKDLIISGGLNVYPKEIELAIDALPGVEESAVVGVMHPDFGEAVIAVVKPSVGAELDTDAMVGALREQLAAFKLPKRIELLDELPRNAMGKVQKNLLRQQFSHLFQS